MTGRVRTVLGVALPKGVTSGYRVASTRKALVIITDDAGRRAETMHWDLVAPCLDDPKIGHRMSNAGAETVSCGGHGGLSCLPLVNRPGNDVRVFIQPLDAAR